MVFESPIEKFLLAAFVVLALATAELSTGFFSHLFQPPAPKEKISASNYPNYIVKKAVPSEKLAITYNPELAIVSPDRTPFIDLVLKIRNEQDVPRTLKLVFPDPATLLTDDPRFVVAHTTFKDENTDQTYHRLVLFLPEKAEKEVKIRYENAYAALDDLKHDVTLELYNEDDQKVADITYRLRSVVLGFWDVWTLPTMPTDKREIVLYGTTPYYKAVNWKLARIQVGKYSSQNHNDSYEYSLPSELEKYHLIHLKIFYDYVREIGSVWADVYVSYDDQNWVKVRHISGTSDQTVDLYLHRAPKKIKAVMGYGSYTSPHDNGDDAAVYLKLIEGIPLAGNEFVYMDADTNATYSLPVQKDGNFYTYRLPDIIPLKPSAVNTVPLTMDCNGQEYNIELPVFYDPDKSDDLLWRMYEQWRSGLEVNGQ